jgi:hypothetical protein
MWTSAACAGIWELSVQKLLHARLPWPLPHDLALKHALLILVSTFALQQLSGQLWRVFVTGVSGQVCAATSQQHADGPPVPYPISLSPSTDSQPIIKSSSNRLHSSM